jgi:hypothetical protein
VIKKNIRFEVLIVANMKTFVFWDVTACGLVHTLCNNGSEEFDVFVFRVEDLTLFYQNAGTYCKIVQHEIPEAFDLYA